MPYTMDCKEHEYCIDGDMHDCVESYLENNADGTKHTCVKCNRQWEHVQRPGHFEGWILLE